MFISAKIRIGIYGTLVCCIGVYESRAMEELTSAIEKKQEEHINPFEKLPLELKAYIVGFLLGARPTTDNAQKVMKTIKSLSLTSKEFYNFINNPGILGNLIQEISKRFSITLTYVALAFQNPGAAEWLKNYIKENPDSQKEIALDQRMLDAVQARNSILAQFLLQAGADFNKTDKDGHPLLHVAARKSDKDMVKLLLNAGDDVNKTDTRSYPTFYWPAIWGQQKMVEFLFQHGADINKTDGSGRTVLYRTAGNNKDIVEFLLKHRADVNRADNHGKTPLHEATFKGNKDIAELLLQAGAKVNTQDKDGWTPLHWSAYYGHREIVKQLLQYGADANMAGNDGRTPLSIAASRGYQDIAKFIDMVKLLRKLGADRYILSITTEQSFCIIS
jgi:ankyrin repeat protein